MSFRVDLTTPELINKAECLLATMWREVVELALRYELMSKFEYVSETLREASLRNAEYYKELYASIYNEEYDEAEKKLVTEWERCPDLYEDDIIRYEKIKKERERGDQS
jgi:hypothetical protein